MSEYLTFPVVLLKCAHVDIKGTVDSVFNYCLFERCISMVGTQDEQIKVAAKDLKVKFGNAKKSYEEGRILFDTIPTNSPKTSIRHDMLFDYYGNSKTEFEVITFIAFAAIRSILQRQPYTKITNEYLIGRMAGNNKPGEPIPDGILKYNNRYQLDKIKLDLQLNWGLKLYGNHTRGFYVSFSMSLESLIKQAELRRKKYKLKGLQRQKEDAKKAVLLAIKGNST